ncbi:MAG: hypothetical protein HY868_13210 [Chloroflexi bacterium]|nr:hypothetical protein [Chloroflexota bacterium]
MRRQIILLIFGLLLAACSTPDPISDADAKWQSKKTTSYRIEVREASFWHIQTNIITVKNDQVVNQAASCDKAILETTKCQVRPIQASEYTVLGMFARAKKYMQGDSAPFTKITYDETWGFPSLIVYNNTRVTDSGVSYQVLKFETLP